METSSQIEALAEFYDSGNQRVKRNFANSRAGGGHVNPTFKLKKIFWKKAFLLLIEGQ